MKGKIVQVEYAGDRLYVVTSEGELWEYLLALQEWKKIK